MTSLATALRRHSPVKKPLGYRLENPGGGRASPFTITHGRASGNNPASYPTDIGDLSLRGKWPRFETDH
jgi:hypothetical protein